MKLVSNAIISLGALALLSVGIYLAATDRAAAATPVLGVAFLFVVLLLLSKFKRFKGFGFEAEMWEEKQEEAAELVDRLEELSKRRSMVKDKIRDKIKEGGPAGNITPTILQEILLDIVDAM